MTIDEAMTKVKMAVEITVIVAGIIAFGAICFMSNRISSLEKELETYKKYYVQEEENHKSEQLILIDKITGEVIYSEWSNAREELHLLSLFRAQTTVYIVDKGTAPKRR